MFNRRPGAMLLLGHKHQCGKGPRLQSRSLAAYSRPLPRSHRLFNPAPPGAGLLYDKVYREDILSHAYELAKSNQGAPGVDGHSFTGIEAAGLEEWLNGIRNDLRAKTLVPALSGSRPARSASADSHRHSDRSPLQRSVPAPALRRSAPPDPVWSESPVAARPRPASGFSPFARLVVYTSLPEGHF